VAARVLETINIAEQARALSKPFTMIDLAQVDDLSLSVYLCQGTMPHHRHLDQDELFLVHSGTISLESEWGTVILRPGELTVAPKGVSHRSSSLLRSAVVLIQPRLMVNRRNGDRRLFALKDERRLEKVSVPAVGRQIAVPFRRVPVADVDTFAMYVMQCAGSGPWLEEDGQSSLVLCHSGRVEVELEEGRTSLGGGELTVVPKGMRYRLTSSTEALVMGVQRHDPPGRP
jgi:homogentisate 1,2-dioxygenase